MGKEITPRKERGDEEVDCLLFIPPFKSRWSLTGIVYLISKKNQAVFKTNSLL
ncbi:hypothetical protein ACQKKK_08150 [Peribacillus sp. NPDC006672]|uniref:hypothetical protein n=1 Tax=Peribacillus sp. NPDC006672 TaxID=3390606 RepID=UPI003CFDA1B5